MTEKRTVPAQFINREISLLAFQRRVLEEAQNESNPLLERVKFLSIFGSNMDEFFMVRVSGIRKQVEAHILDACCDNLAPTEILAATRKQSLELYKEALIRHPYHGLCQAERVAEEKSERSFQGSDLPGADPAGLRSRPPVPAHFQPQFEPGDHHQG
jgi:polyphosphate kinase